MNILQLVLLVLSIFIFGMVLIHLQHSSEPCIKDDHDHQDMQKLMKLVLAQNETIYALESHLKAKHNELGQMSQDYKKLIEISDKFTHIDPHSLEKRKEDVIDCPQPSSPSSALQTSYQKTYSWPLSQLEQECENRYGLELVHIWKQNKQSWCGSPEDKSELICYPYHQAHKKLDGRGPDVFCEARNFVLDFNKVHGEHEDKKPSLGSQYLGFDKGSIASSCKPTHNFKSNMFMPHHSIQMRSFEHGKALTPDEVIDTTTYLLARDEDCENSFHSTADFMNMFLVGSVLDLNFADVQVMLFDKHPDGPYHELISKAFSPNHPVLRHQHYQGKKVMFKKLIFHLESPAGLIFPKVSRPDPLRCYDTSLFQAYRRFVLHSFNLLDTKPPEIPTITLSLRHRTASKNVGRVMGNEDEVKKVLAKGNMINLHIEDTAKLSYGEQLKLIRNTNILVGIHGAGLMFIMFAAEEAILIEIHPSYRQDRHFRHAARMTGKIYMPIRTLTRETCVGSSDTVTVPIEEFERTLDGAVRIARNFDDGLSECGLVCPSQILALDGRLDNFYKNGERKGRSVDTQFPCG